MNCFKLSYKDNLRLFQEGVRIVDGKRMRMKGIGYDLAKEWFKEFSSMSDTLPTTGIKNLPSCLTKCSVYTLYEEEMKRKGQSNLLITRQHFVNCMWAEEFPHVVIPKVKIL